MWKYVSRRFRECERGANHFDKRGTTGVVNAGNTNEEKNKKSGPPCRWFKARACWGPNKRTENTHNNKKWNFEHLTSTWMGAITWSGALVIGWYASQLIQWKYKYYARLQNQKCDTNVVPSLHPYLSSLGRNPAYLNSVSKIEKLVSQFSPNIYLVTNEQNGAKKESASTTSSSSNTDSSDDMLGEVLNSIENKLGLAAIENGQMQDGLKLLRSAASRSYAPALYNLAICYEMGLGVTIDEKMAMELYRSAAALEHPGALYNLGIYYGKGIGGLARDTVTATRLLRLAAVQGQEDAIQALKTLGVDDEEPIQNKPNPWSYLYNPQFPINEKIVPIPTALFVENLNYSHPQDNEATVY